MGKGLAGDIKIVEGEEDEPMLPLIFTHTYDDVEINTTVPWDELDTRTQVLAKKVVDYYQMQASVKVDSDVTIRSLNITDHDPDEGMVYSIIATVEPVDEDDINTDELFKWGEDDDG